MPAIDPITVPVTMLVTNAAPLRAVTDALTDLATAIRNMLDDQAERESTATEAVLAHVLDERRRQDVKWGEQNHSDGTGPDIRWQPGIQSTATAAVLADEFRRRCQANSPGEDTWRDILLEEVAEALAENDPAKLRAELVQVAAVAVQWIEAIDRREIHPEPEPTTEPKPDAPIDLDSLGLGAVVRAGIGEDPRVLWVRMPDGGLWCSDARGIRCIDAYWLRGTVSSDLTDVEVLHPGITIGGEGV